MIRHRRRDGSAESPHAARRSEAERHAPRRSEAGRSPESWAFVLEDFHSDDPAMRRCLEFARIAARTDLPVLILGESGTGKTLLARAIHNSSRRARRAFVAFNSAALSDTLLDSQLFGHERGAFTGADKRVKGKFELADGGTLFIDEIADMTPAAQAKILRAVEYGEFERLGSESLQVADVRLMSATHLPLRRFLESEQFRKDLFYRISGIRVTIPPLRERPADLRSLIAAEVDLACREQEKVIVGLEPRAADLLFAYPWPGNLRELKRVVHTAVALSPARVLEAESILLESPLAPAYAGQAGGVESEGAGGRSSLAAGGVPGRPGSIAGRPAEQGLRDGDLSLRTAELAHIRRVLERMGGNKRAAARVLGLSRSTLSRKLSQATQREA